MKQAETWAALAVLLKTERDKALSVRAHRTHASAIMMLGALANVAGHMAETIAAVEANRAPTVYDPKTGAGSVEQHPGDRRP